MCGFYHVAATRFQGRSERSLDRKPVQLVALISFMICGSQCSGQRRKSHSRYSAAMGTGIGRGPNWSVTRGRTTDVSKDALARTRNHSA